MPHDPTEMYEPQVAVWPPGFGCVSTRTASMAIVAVAGELDIATAPELDDALRRAADGGSIVVLDLRRLEFMDCAGAQLVLAADRRIRAAGGRLVVVRGMPEVDWFFKLLGIDLLVELVAEPPTDMGRDHRASARGPVASRRVNGGRSRPITAARLLEDTIAERDELRTRVAALEQELLMLVCPPPPELDDRPLSVT